MRNRFFVIIPPAAAPSVASLGTAMVNVPVLKAKFREPRPWTRHGIDIDVVGGIQKAPEHGDLSVLPALPPVEVGPSPALTAERWLDEPHIADVEAESAGRHIRVGVPMLDLPNEGPGVTRLPTDKIPRAIEPGDASTGAIFADTVVWPLR